jgi:Putative DNA-binding domain
MTQKVFRTALLDPEMPMPPGLVGPDGGTAGRRFDVYRNNVSVGLKDALAASFPVLRALLGEDFFGAMSGVFLRMHPPSSPMMMFYGADMPDFLAGFGPARHLGYLPDIARLELAIRRSYHAADSTPLDPTVLATLAPEALLAARPVLAPSFQLLRSDWPVHAIWAANTQGAAPPTARQAEDVAILRPDFDPLPHLLPQGSGSFVASLAAGATFGAALEASGSEFDLAATITLLVSCGAITGLEQDTRP